MAFIKNNIIIGRKKISIDGPLKNDLHRAKLCYIDLHYHKLIWNKEGPLELLSTYNCLIFVKMQMSSCKQFFRIITMHPFSKYNVLDVVIEFIFNKIVQIYLKYKNCNNSWLLNCELCELQCYLWHPTYTPSKMPHFNHFVSKI